MKPGSALRKPFASGNFFRAQWMYRRLPQGDAMLQAGRGMSPAFFALLKLIEPHQPVSFGELGQSLAWLHADDLELWLAELCRMGLIAPAADGVREEPRLVEVAVAPPPAAPEPAATGIDWKRVSLDALYEELLAICVELQVREGEAPAVLAA